MKRIIIAATIVAALGLVGIACSSNLSTSSGKTLVTVNGTKITEGDLAFIGKINPRIEAQLATPAGKKRILDNLVEQEMFYQEAVKKGINRDPDVRAKAELYRRVIVAQSLLDKEIDDAAQKYYKEHPEEFQKLKMSQVLIRYDNPTDKAKAPKGAKVRTEAEALKFANDVKARLDKGEAFDKVAAEVSDDVATKSRGGDMGLVAKNDPRFAARGYGPLVEKAYEMKVGEIAGPIKTEKAYHIITVTKDAELEPFDTAKNEILMKLKGDMRTQLLARLKKDGSVTFTEELAPKAPPSATKPAEGEKPEAALTPPAGQEPQLKIEAPKDEAKPAADAPQAKEGTLSTDTTVKVKVATPKDAPKNE